MPNPIHAEVMVPRHSRATRFFHAGLALAIVTQLLTSRWMHGNDAAQAGDILFQMHRHSGLTATVLVFGLWLTILVRSRGTQLGALIPWFSGQGLAALWRETKAHLVAAVHGFGLVLITAMAASGAVSFFQVALGLHSAESDGMLAMTLHLALANLVWAFLNAHVGLAVLQHPVQSMRLSTMWSLGR